MNNIKSLALFWLLSVVLVSILGLLTFMNLEEWYEISVLKNTSGYPLGGEGPTPYYYKTLELYASVSLTLGIIFLLTLTFGVGAIIKRNKKGLITAFGTTILLLVGMFAQGMIE